MIIFNIAVVICSLLRGRGESKESGVQQSTRFICDLSAAARRSSDNGSRKIYQPKPNASLSQNADPAKSSRAPLLRLSSDNF